MQVRKLILGIIILINLIIISFGVIFTPKWFWLLIIPFPLLVIALYHSFQTKHAILRNYPLVGYFRYFLESIRPELRQYFWESDTDGRPFNRRQRSIVYQRAKNQRETVAFGMQSDPQAVGNEWAAHSIFPVHIEDHNLRTTVGNAACKQPYSLSVFNISAMSYGALSRTAITALNKGAALQNFAHNTGEGGISQYHINGGDLIWQVGTGYFGCRDENGYFEPNLFREKSTRPYVKMIELKLSQGAKPGHGGILPAAKNTPEVAAIRHVVPGTDVMSPPAHSSFKTPVEMMNFIQKLRELSDYKPVGFKLCIGDKQEFIEICQAMQETQIMPDFISIDGSEGGTGAAPLEFTDNLGMPLYDALAFVTTTLINFGLKKHIKIIVSSRIVTGFDILKVIALGADACYSARGMMFALGCIQALKCNEDVCPVGVATQQPHLYKGLNVDDKYVRVAQFHRNTLRATVEIMEACGFNSLDEVNADKFFRKVDSQNTLSFQDIYFKNTGKLVNNRSDFAPEVFD
ncbi:MULTISPECIES: FMN-binding glutamate synthase family protein [Sphingobacterium]|uniref:FMN-binding glutamate synthase family protein n=1 Tax=Sphingobacterium cellulitidis TaxID=1768011 RepID=A0A8H9FYD3_9SPHI|nr:MULTISPECIES: FMN-binding glutamate synthase family protein [Sphingobacterium]MBA8985824.1 glutamate synthase domain-containing protein 2 [Sphingobacterium soli]OYD43712.1 FMN-binding glutamate synthase family protein [Sphingobacterium cellulitidis]OYD46969.1 FMN-binding glutamate synthase family protein [Sphingobacterium cellulitidis]WFB64234.1 FMN-binding glutamate synthase family protein [Sphingobacterium sp. WM]GGE06586.1 FMN-binding glutamate synthase family protein [Sphingobacterium s